jgi:hypothetical protein
MLDGTAMAVCHVCKMVSGLVVVAGRDICLRHGSTVAA